jgi:hypothetical protein
MGYPADYKIKVRQGATLRRTLRWIVNKEPVDLTGWKARLMARESIDSEAVVQATTENGYISLGGEEGTITLVLPASVTAAIPPGRYLYDMELIAGSSPSADVTSLIAGQFLVSAEITR